MECLSLVLNTGYKRKLLIPIREAYVKPSDLAKFNQLVQAQGLATSYRQRQKAAEKTILNSKGDGLKKIDVKRDSDGEWGFSIRGGSEHGLGIFVSWIEPGSNAEKCGLQVGDQILKANDTSFTNINHYDAVTVSNSTSLIQICYKFQVHYVSGALCPLKKRSTHQEKQKKQQKTCYGICYAYYIGDSECKETANSYSCTRSSPRISNGS